ncbi:sigma factor [Rothia kristinae]|nr:sigma factor [Rothia kristinae]
MAGTSAWTEAMTDAWLGTRNVIAGVLAGAGQAQDTNDVMQKTWIAANASLERFDPELGTFEAWMRGIGHFQAKKHLAAESGKARINDAVAMAAASGALTPFDVVGADPGEQVMSQLDAIRRISRVLVILRQVVGDVPVLLERSMHLVLTCDGDASVAARRLGVRVEALRDSHRNILDLAQVIDKALDRHWARVNEGIKGGVQFWEVRECLPGAEGGPTRRWVTALGDAVAMCGGLGRVTPAVLAERTGWSETTCRHGLARTLRLMSVATPLIRDGELKPGTRVGLTDRPAGREQGA